jgi:signal transduction histidine kinase
MTLTGASSQADFQEMAASTIEESDGMLRMIDTMLDIAEAEAGVINLNVTSFNFAAMVRKLCELYEPVVTEKQLKVVMDAPEITMVSGDLQKLQRVAANLLDNAIKYSPNGGEISLTLEPSGPNARFALTNPGPGIAPQDIPHIFERFYRADKSRSGSGNGLGLSLVHAIVHAHGGQIAVESIPGEKTTFTLTLPTARRTPLPQSPQITNI